VAERFLQLTPDQIYELAHSAAAGGGPPPAPRARDTSSPDAPVPPASPALSHQPPTTEDPESYRRIVEAVTRALTAELQLPAFEEWRAAYEASPEQYDEELLGLWREGI
jgi:hypothetical protein